MAKKRRKSNKKDYWTQETEQAIERYLALEPASKEAEYLFEKEIYDPLKKLVENIMFRYQLSIQEYPAIDQIHDTIGHIVMKMRKFDPSKGHKSFSYYGTIAKNYLIMKSNKHYNKKIQSVDIEDVVGFEFEQELFEHPTSEDELKSKALLIQIIANDLDTVIKNDLSLNGNVYKVAEAVIFLLKNYLKINVHNKRQFYYLVREFTGLNAKEITKAMKQIKQVYEQSQESLR